MSECHLPAGRSTVPTVTQLTSEHVRQVVSRQSETTHDVASQLSTCCSLMTLADTLTITVVFVILQFCVMLTLINAV